MRKILLLLFLPLAACQTASATAPSKAAVIRSQVDTSVAKAAATLHDNCALLQTGLSIGEAFAKGKEVQNAIAKAEVTLNSFCMGPTPTDVPTALAAVAKAYSAVILAKQAQAQAAGT